MSTAKEISIFHPHILKKTSTKTERMILFEHLELNTDIPHYHFESFNESEDVYLDEIRIKSDIPAVLIKNNIDFLGLLVKKKTSTEFHISVQLNSPVFTKNIELQNQRVASTNSKIDVVGVMFDNTKNPVVSTRLKTILETSTIRDKIISGIFGLYSFYFHSYYDIQLTKSKFFQDQTYLKVKNKQFMVHFKNNDNTKKALSLIRAYVDHMVNYYNDSLHFMYSSLEYPHSKLAESIRPTHNLGTVDRVLKNPLLIMINSIYTNNLTTIPSHMVLLYDLVYGKLLFIYQFAKLMGLDDPVVKKLISVEKNRQKNNKINYDGIIHNINQETKYYKKMFIARSLFHRYNLEDLTSEEVDVVNLTYQKDLEFASHVMKNNCEHLNLLKRVMQSNNAGKYFDNRAWEELKKIIPQTNTSNKDGLLQCSLCELLVLCPHHYDQFEHKTNKGFKQKGSSDTDLRLMLLKKYADTTPIEDAYFCKICGEKIVAKYNEEHASFIQGEKVHITYTVDTLNNTIWKEVRKIISDHITFTVVTDANLLTTNITDIIQPYVEDEQTRLKNIKTNTLEIIQNTVFLYINLYAYVSLIRIMSHHPDDIQFIKGFDGFIKKGKSKQTQGGNNTNTLKNKVSIHILQGLLKTGYSLLITTKSSLIQKIPSISMNTIKPLFIMAFKNISKLYIREAEFSTNLPPEYVANSVVYSYLFYVNKKQTPELKYSDVKKILGVELQDVVNLENITDNAIIPPIWKLQPPDENIGFYNDPKYLELYHKYTYASFIHFIKYVKNGLHNIPVFGSVKHANHAEEFKNLKITETTLQNYTQARYKTNIFLYYNKQYWNYSYKEIDLSKIYCPDGQKHIFNIHIYENDMTRFEISKKNIDEWMFDGEKNREFRQMKRVDLKCSVCGTLLSKTEDTTGENSITNILDRNDELNGFYIMYTFKCPVKNIHTFEKDKCTQCGVTKLMIFTKDMDYYKKYKNVFYSELEKKNTWKNEQKKHRNISNKITKSNIKPWVIDNTPLIELSRISKVHINVINNIGMIEGNNYEKIENGDYNPGTKIIIANNGDPFINQLIQLESYMNAFIIDYEMLKNGRTAQSSLEPFTKKWENIDFSKFPIVANEYHTLRRQYIQSGFDVKTMVNFILYSFSKAIVNIYKHYEYKTDALDILNFDAAVAFVKYTMDKVVTSEKAISDPGILRGKLLVIDDDYAGDAIEADYDDNDVDINENFDPFSLELSGIDNNEMGDNYATNDD
jgi:hypothetical protein